ncbi:hypothetical protein [Actinomadura roseirufa]|uniref:hypothetical protein n=1 Tax=Actinomadura roseirufa TaxID=2094049 RepID=UPI001041B585|nr:hypothetical protein [Actinomadura roseirufa]
MMLDSAPSPVTRVTPAADHPASGAAGDTAVLALSLFTTWAARTGRSLPAGPVDDLSPEEIIEFWVDDQLEPPYDSLPTRVPA